MTDRSRARLVFLPVTVFFGLYAYASLNLPAWGDYRGPYGDAISHLAVFERHATDAVNAINYDYRAFDTLGEEFILFTAVIGLSMLLRQNTETSARSAGKVIDTARLSPAVRLTNLPAVLVTVIFGFYIGFHGQLTPGGGFQAGVILATAPLLLYICEDTDAFRRVTSHSFVEVIEAIGAGGYAIIGLAPLIAGLPLLTNILPLGITGNVFSSGTIALISVCVGVEVTASFLVTICAYLENIITGTTPED